MRNARPTPGPISDEVFDEADWDVFTEEDRIYEKRCRALDTAIIKHEGTCEHIVRAAQTYFNFLMGYDGNVAEVAELVLVPGHERS